MEVKEVQVTLVPERSLKEVLEAVLAWVVLDLRPKTLACLAREVVSQVKRAVVSLKDHSAAIVVLWIALESSSSRPSLADHPRVMGLLTKRGNPFTCGRRVFQPITATAGAAFQAAMGRSMLIRPTISDAQPMVRSFCTLSMLAVSIVTPP